MRVLQLLPRPLHRLLYRLAYQARRLWSRGQGGASLLGCGIIARDEAGRFLLVRHSYGPRVWTFPGGGIRKRETPMMAIVREVREELSCELADLARVTTLKEPFLGGTNISHVFTGRLVGTPRPDRRELLEARFFARDEFPADLSRTVLARMAAFDRREAGPARAALEQG